MHRQSVREKNEEKHFDEMAGAYNKNYGYDSLFTQYKIEKKTTLVCESIVKKYANKKIRILELGAGTGAYTFLLAKALKNANIEAIDISQKIIQIAQENNSEKKRVRFSKQSAYATTYEDGAFDVVVGFYVLHHLNLNKTVREVSRVLKPGGLALFYEPNLLNPYVFLVKSVPFLKNIAGDSPDEWAINPLTIANEFEGFKAIKISTSEFISPTKHIHPTFLQKLDKFTAFLSKLPLIQFLGGSVFLSFQKK